MTDTPSDKTKPPSLMVATPAFRDAVERRALSATTKQSDLVGEVRQQALNLHLGYAWSDKGKEPASGRD